ncbi:AraC family transcriptional regulator [Dyella mobilis]|uniref:AraC family transcriptional regulator n=1 Tax=Dyella mobilis TaxID=1849582 RepID=A0ABS2KC97_9GAMM|nr:AraC family transcriptional regulator [Dyella mobilis]MBM7128660.1 AraC family transcriptional regulator [Dyella mobilis]GLQ98982.1 AraC family transcriptional regulator [Dyella mobilis]
MDPLSDFLALLRPRSAASSRFDAGGGWSIRFGGQQQRHIKSYVVLAGECWLAVDGREKIERLEQGDCFVLPTGCPFRLASDLGLPSVSALTLFPAAGPGGVVTLADGDDFSMLVSRFAVTGKHADQLLQMLPAVVRLHKDADQAALRWLAERMMHELREPKPGSDLVTQDIAHMTLVLALRAHLNGGLDQDTGWFFALADQQLSRAITAMHAEPSRRWTVRELGKHAGMSRSVFALRFKAAAGETPMQYLARWRMLLACDRLEHSSDSVATIAEALGYESESAFGTAFKRVLGCSPRQYSKACDEDDALDTDKSSSLSP